jgi:hypothetical protein
MSTKTIIAGVAIAAAAIAYFYIRSRRKKLAKTDSGTSDKSEITP